MAVNDNDPHLISRRALLQATAALAPVTVAGRVVSRLLPEPPHTEPSALVELGARDAVERIRTGDLKAEAYVQRLIAQYHAHRDLNAVNWISEPRVLEAARAVDRARAKGTRLPPLAGLPIAIKNQMAVAGYPSITVPMGFVGPLPVGMSFIGGAFTEAKLIGLAYAFEQATKARRAPRFLATAAYTP